MAINLLAVAALLAVSLGPVNATTPKDKQPLAKMIGVSDPVQAQSPTKYEPIADLSGTTMMVEARPTVSESVFLEKGQLLSTFKDRFDQISPENKYKIYSYFKLVLDNTTAGEKDIKKAANSLVGYFFEIEKKVQFMNNPQGGYG